MKGRNWHDPYFEPLWDEWELETAGMFQDDPLFDEMLAEAAAYRRALLVENWSEMTSSYSP